MGTGRLDLGENTILPALRGTFNSGADPVASSFGSTARRVAPRSTVPEFAARLLAWFSAHRRDLPWRRTRDPWAIWVSEVMLQQTRVQAVRGPFERFLQRFPTPAAFAAATDDELLAAWRGLGYYRRARLLRDGARCVVAEHGGAVPDDPAELGALPGIGAYTRGAIGSIAFGRAEPAVDGNVERVVARHLALHADVKSAAMQRRIRQAVLDWLPADRAGDFNQALMELGATVCTPGDPDCARCPVAADCRGRSEGLAAALPVRKPPRAAVEVTARVALAAGPRGVLGCRLPDGGPNAGQLELPGAGMLHDSDEAGLATCLREHFGARIQLGPVVATVAHAITHHRITLHAHAATATRAGALQWWPTDDATPWTTPSRKVFRAALGHGRPLRA
jgi:A/G-specific adenine glycosylase